MGMFVVSKGSPVIVVKQGKDWIDNNFQKMNTTKDNVFDKSEIVLEPVSNLVVPLSSTIGYYLQQKGFYGFLYKGWYMIVHSQHVQYG